MKDNLKAVSEALNEAGFKTTLEQSEGMPLDFKITPYSLNTKLSFRFENLEELSEFLVHSSTIDSSQLHASFMELGLNPNEFFWVNFFEKGIFEIFERGGMSPRPGFAPCRTAVWSPGW